MAAAGSEESVRAAPDAGQPT
eukprot:COSAG01_NODE_27298_length_689_cov_1.042373_1_plen_20_part_10